MHLWYASFQKWCVVQIISPHETYRKHVGFNDDPIARRVRDMPSDFFLLTNRFICDSRRMNSPGCGTSHQGTDPHIIEQLPRFVQAAFPGMLLFSFYGHNLILFKHISPPVVQFRNLWCSRCAILLRHDSDLHHFLSLSLRFSTDCMQTGNWCISQLPIFTVSTGLNRSPHSVIPTVMLEPLPLSSTSKRCLPIILQHIAFLLSAIFRHYH